MLLSDMNDYMAIGGKLIEAYVKAQRANHYEESSEYVIQFMMKEIEPLMLHALQFFETSPLTGDGIRQAGQDLAACSIVIGMLAHLRDGPGTPRIAINRHKARTGTIIDLGANKKDQLFRDKDDDTDPTATGGVGS